MSKAEAVNTQTADFQEPIVQPGGSGAISFDELEAVTETRKEVKKIQKEEDEEISDKETKKEKKAEKKGDKDGNEEESEKSKESKKGKEASQESKPKLKLLKLELDGKSVEVPYEAPVPVKVAGKVENVPLQELINQYSGKVNWDRKNTDLHQRAKQFEENQAVLRKAVQQTHKFLVQDGDVPKMVWYLSQAMGANPKEVWSKAYNNMRQFVEKHGSLPEEAQKLHELELENEFLKSSAENMKQSGAKAQATEQMQKDLAHVMETHGIDESKVVELYDDLRESGIKEEDIDPKLLGEYAYQVSVQDMVSSVLSDVASDLDPEEAEEALNIMTRAILRESGFDPDSQKAKFPYSKEDIEEAILKNYGNKAEKKLTKKIEKSEAKSEGSRKPKNPGSDPMFFSDLDE